MQVFGIDIAQITELATQVANAGALHTIERVGDELFEMVIGVAVLVASQNPQ